MGCNTSKESVQPAAEEAKEDVKNGDIPKTQEDSVTEKASTKAPSATDPPKEQPQEGSQSEEKEEEGDDSEKEKEEAATRIQAAFRGHHARKSMKETESSVKQTESKSESEAEQLQNEFRADDKELCDAATKIQASFRGHMSRKEQAATALAKTVEDTAAKIEEKVQDAVDELEGIDLTDPDLNKAATKIQASFRGHKVRQEVSGVSPSTDESKN